MVDSLSNLPDERRPAYYQEAHRQLASPSHQSCKEERKSEPMRRPAGSREVRSRLLARQSADQTTGSAVSICYEAALRQDFAERRHIAKILAVALARRIELIVSARLILSRL
jgi:hypothetical protein